MKSILVVLVFGLLVLTCTPSKKEENFVKGYEEAYIKGSFDLAKEELNKCDSEKCLAFGEYLMANLYKQNGQYDSAIVHAGKALIFFEETNNKDLIVSLKWFSGEVLRLSQNHEMAEVLYKEALLYQSSEEKEMRIQLDLAKSLYSQHKGNEAYLILKTTSKYFSKTDKNRFAHSQFLEGNVLADHQKGLQKPDFEEAYIHYHNALEHFKSDNNKAQVLNNLGDLCLAEGKLERAKFYLDSAVKMQKDSSLVSSILYNYGKLSEAKGDKKNYCFVCSQILKDDQILSLEANACYRELLLKRYELRNDSLMTALIYNYTFKVDNQIKRYNYMNEVALRELFQKTLTKSDAKEIRKRKDLKFVYPTVVFIILILLSIRLYYSRVSPRLRRIEKAKKIADKTDLMLKD